MEKSRLLRGVLAFEGELAPAAFGVVHRHVGAFDQFGGSHAVFRKDRNTNAGADARKNRHGTGTNFAWQLYRLDYFFGDYRQHCFIACFHQQRQKFIAAMPAYGVVVAQRTLEALCDRLQHPVTNIVSEGIVYFLEVIEIDEHDRQRPAVTFSLRERVLKTVVE